MVLTLIEAPYEQASHSHLLAREEKLGDEGLRGFADDDLVNPRTKRKSEGLEAHGVKHTPFSSSVR
jgi:hypothetical protein